MRRGLAFVLAAFLALPACADDDRVLLPEQTQPDHMRGLHSPLLDPHPLPPYTIMVRPRVVYVLPDSAEALADPERELSRLCRRGAFIQASNRFFSAVSPKRNYGVAFPTGGSLIDLASKARANRVYFFENQSANCSVYSAVMAKMMPYYRP